MRRLLIAGLAGMTAAAGLCVDAWAADGRLEIDQVCATATGCFGGDAAGYPITIDGSAGHSYVLTSDLVIPNENTTGIQLAAPSLSIDMNGFRIVRAGCETATSDCKPASGTGYGIDSGPLFAPGFSIRDGSVIGMGMNGMRLPRQSAVSRIRAIWNREIGLTVLVASRVVDSVFYGNGTDGLRAWEGSIVLGNSTHENGGDGLHINSSGVYVSRNTSHDNAGNGIDAGFSCLLRENTAYQNAGDGINTSGKASILENTSYANGGVGIFSQYSSLVLGNTIQGNTGFGLFLSLAGQPPALISSYRENVINGNTAGSVFGGLNFGSNSCNGTTSCP